MTDLPPGASSHTNVGVRCVLVSHLLFLSLPSYAAERPCSFVTPHTSTTFTFYMRCIINFSASQRHCAWGISPLEGYFYSYSDDHSPLMGLFVP